MPKSVKVKICGITDNAAINACHAEHVDFLGFICYPKSPRHVEPSIYAQLAANVAPAEIVLVTVNADDATLSRYCEQFQPDYIQCHGKESPERCAQIAKNFNVKIIKAISVAQLDDLDEITKFVKIAEIVLLDAKPAKGELPGGNAKSFDWQIVQQYEALPLHWMLSGGLKAENLKQAIMQTQAPMIDLSSGVEFLRQSGEASRKDPELIKQLMKLARSA